MVSANVPTRTFSEAVMESQIEEFLIRLSKSFPQFAERLGDGTAYLLEHVQLPASDSDIEALEREVELPLPESYKSLLRCSRGFWLHGGAFQFGPGHLFFHEFEPLEQLPPHQRAEILRRGGHWPPHSQGMLCFAEYWIEGDGDQVLFDVSKGLIGSEYPVMYYAHEHSPPQVRLLAEGFHQFLEALLEDPA
jgi:hypothetical protein